MASGVAAKPGEKPPICEEALHVVRKLMYGNRGYAASDSGSRLQHFDQVEKLLEDPLDPVTVQALLISCSRAAVDINTLFGTTPGEVMAFRVCGNICNPGDPDDGVVGSVEFALSQASPPLVIVLGNSDNFVVEAAVRCAMIEAGMTDVPQGPKLTGGYSEKDMGLVQHVLPSARDALLQHPHLQFKKLCELAAKLNVWNTVQVLLSTSCTIYDRVLAGTLEVQGAFLNLDTGKVQFLGKHPSQDKLLVERPCQEVARTAEAPPVPSDEAHAALYAGNRRYCAGNGGQVARSYDERLLRRLSEAGQNPMAVVLGCADSRAPIEILFDVMPGDLFVLRNAGNTLNETSGGTIGSVEYAVAHLKTELLVVAGHSQCGAVTAAVGAMRRKESLEDFGGRIGWLLEYLHQEAQAAVDQLPKEPLKAQVVLATKLNVLATMEKLIRYSEIVRNAVERMDLQIHGAVYDIFNGEIHWVGQHPKLEGILERELPVYRWKVTPYSRTSESIKSNPLVEALQAGNLRFVSGQTEVQRAEKLQDPSMIIVAGSEVRVPVETIFDSQPGQLLVQLCVGNIAGHRKGSLFKSLEYAVARFAPKLLVVMGGSHSSIIQKAIQAASGGEAASGKNRIILDRVTVSAARAIEQVAQDGSSTAAGRDIKIQQLFVELNALYTLEQLLRHSQIIRTAVKCHGLELHVAVLNEATGEVEFLGTHPMHEHLLS
eukprot:CAMPEP_0170574018 /NCGR_PEP_ID=MMETSP0224-20130122/3075_1 /TAXON_ID=285029 /ORGANISM="Togula jolla, Strain CCCM 725" /LENGTH=713 /DNA_ID=CAMNT_0010896645 /DNA_START=25 /DNA_END=2163 /DNA_ORIENTATION=-